MGKRVAEPVNATALVCGREDLGPPVTAGNPSRRSQPRKGRSRHATPRVGRPC
jgi:hypothetical protein